MEESGDCCGFILTESGEQNWRVASHESIQFNKDKMQIKETDLAAHLHIYMHLCEPREKKRNDRTQRPVAGNRSVEAGWSSAGKGWDDSSAAASPVQNPEHVSDERVTTALHMIQDHLQQTTVIYFRRSQKTLSELAASRTKGNSAYEPLNHANSKKERGLPTIQNARMPQKPRRSANGAVKNTLEKKNGALEKHVKTVTMRAESLATTEAKHTSTAKRKRRSTCTSLRS